RSDMDGTGPEVVATLVIVVPQQNAASARRDYRRDWRLIGIWVAAGAVDGASAFLRGEAALSRRCRWLARSASLSPCRGSLNERDEPCSCGLPVFDLGSMLPAVDHQHAFFGHPPASQRREPFFHRGRQRRSADVEAQFDRCGDLVYRP